MKKSIIILVLLFKTTFIFSQIIFLNGESVSCYGENDGYYEFSLSDIPFNLQLGFPYSIEWENGETTQNIYNLEAGFYSGTISDNTYSYGLVLTISEPLPIIVQDSISNTSCFSCNDGAINVQVSGGIPPYSFQWSNGSFGSSLSELSSGGFDLTITDDNECTVLKHYSVINPAPEIQEIPLSAGWNLISTFKEHGIFEVDSFFYELDTNLQIVKYWNGDVFWPKYEINSIDSINNHYGYQIRIHTVDTMHIAGSNINPVSQVISLPEGWCTIGYLRYVPGNTVDLLSQLGNNLIIIRDDKGGVYWPKYSINNLSIMNPGEAYSIKLKSAMSFTYPTNSY